MERSPVRAILKVMGLISAQVLNFGGACLTSFRKVTEILVFLFFLSPAADFSKPTIHADPPVATCGSTLLILTCSSHGGYPAPTMSGLLNNNKVEWSHTFTFDNQTGLINITSSLQLNVTEDIFVLCSVSYSGFQVSTSYNYSRFPSISYIWCHSFVECSDAGTCKERA